MRLSLKTAILLAVVLLFLSRVSHSGWIQLGEAIESNWEISSFGWSLDISQDGNVIAVGDWTYNRGLSFRGRAVVYAWDGANWNQRGPAFLGPLASTYCGSGVALGLNGTRLAVGYRSSSMVSEHPCGYVSIFDWTGSEWVQFSTVLSGDTPGEGFGRKLTMSSNGERLAVSSLYGGNPAIRTGQVQVFELIVNEWVQIGSDINGENENDYFGDSVVLSGDGNWIAIGASEYDAYAEDQGQITVYTWESNDWVQKGVGILGDEEGDKLGSALALSADGSRLAAGAWRHDSMYVVNTGQVRVYEFDGHNWLIQGSTIEGSNSIRQVGRSIAITSNGSRIAYGAPYSNTQPIPGGVSRVHDWINSDWIQIGKDLAGDEGSYYFGYQVCLSATGHRIAVSDPYGDPWGDIRIFEYVESTPTPSPTPSPTITQTPIPSPTPPCENHGVTLSMPAHSYYPGDACGLNAVVCNSETETLFDHVLLIALEAGGDFYFAPAWKPSSHGLSFYRMDFLPGTSTVFILDRLFWPDVPPGSGYFCFWGALLNPDLTRVLGEIDTWEFVWY